jgi:hypothetical protein
MCSACQRLASLAGLFARLAAGILTDAYIQRSGITKAPAVKSPHIVEVRPCHGRGVMAITDMFDFSSYSPPKPIALFVVYRETLHLRQLAVSSMFPL